jgi:hypothetical protein
VREAERFDYSQPKLSTGCAVAAWDAWQSRPTRHDQLVITPANSHADKMIKAARQSRYAPLPTHKAQLTFEDLEHHTQERANLCDQGTGQVLRP